MEKGEFGMATKIVRMSEVMKKQHPRWDEFIQRLAGPEGCDFREEPDGRPTSRCQGKKLTKAVLKAMGGVNIPASITYFEKNGGYCDCEVVLNLG